MNGPTVLLIVLALVLVGCGGTPASETTEASAANSATTSPPSGFEERTIGLRSFLLFAPSTLDPGEPAPLVINSHGWTEDPSAQWYRYFHQTAEAEGIVVVYPNAVRATWDLKGDSDLIFITALIDEMSSEFNIDQDRVYAIGHSLGGELSTYLACRLPDRITAVASVAMLHHHEPPTCATSSSARVLSIVGKADRIYNIDSGVATPIPGAVDPPGPLEDEIAAFTATNGCDPEPTETPLEEGAVRRDYTCESDAALVVYIHSGGHTWPVNRYGLNTNQIIWDFLSQYTAPLSTG